MKIIDVVKPIQQYSSVNVRLIKCNSERGSGFTKHPLISRAVKVSVCRVATMIILVFLKASPLAASELVELIYPKDQAHLETTTIKLAWNVTPFNSLFQVQVSDDSLFNNILLDVTTAQKSNTFNAPQSNKKYYWRVRLVSEYTWGDFYRFQVFKPADLSGIKFHTRSDIGVVTSGTKVTNWNDQSLNANNSSQAEPTLQPTLVASAPLINNYPSLRFGELPGSNHYLSFASPIALNNFSVFSVYSFVPDASVPAHFLVGGALSGFFSEYPLNSWGYGTLSLFNGGFNAAPNFLTDKNYAIYTYKNTKLRRNMVPPYFYAATDAISSITLNIIGGRGDAPSFGFKGDVAEILMYDSDLDSTNTLKVEEYLHFKYAPPVNLGVDTVFGASFCDTFRINAGSNYVSYRWSTGDTLSSVKVFANGQYSVKVKDVFGFESTDDFIVLPYKKLNNKTIYLCQGDTLRLNLNLPSGFTAAWSNGAVGSNVKLYETGTYTVRIDDARSCFVYDTINVVLDNPVLSPNPSGGSLTLCEGEKLFAVAATGFDSLLWSTGSTNTFITVVSPGNYSIFGITNSGCILNQNFNVTIAGQAPAADFISSALCEDATTTFTDISTYPVGNSITSWKWSFGDGNTAAVSDPVNIYSNTGNYNVSLKVITNVGCSDSIVKIVTVRKRPKADFFNLLSCSDNPTTFVDNSIPNADSIQAWLWNFAGLGSSTEKNPKFYYPSPSIYNTLLKVTNSHGCTDTITYQTIVNPSPVADFRADSACVGTNTIFTNLSTVSSPNILTNYSWNYGDETQSIQVSQPHLYADYGEYEVQLAIRSSNQCVDTVVNRVRVFANPEVDFTISNTQCVGKSIQFTDVSTTPDGSALTSWKWFFAGQGASILQNPSFTFNAQGNYTIQLTAKTAQGCSGSQFRSIAVTSPPVVKFSFTPNYGPPPLDVSYTNQSPTNGNYIWDYGDGSPTYFGYTPPSHTYTVRGTYPIKLLATDFKGCSDSLVRDILVDNAVVDGVMVTVNVVANGDFYKVVVTILNNSNIEVTTLGITIRLANGSEIRETWTGSLKPGNSVIYPFTGELRYNAEGGDIPVICATIESININAVESDLSNNSNCEEITVGPFELLTVYPNPATDYVNFGVMLPENGEVEITIYDIMGKLLYSMKFAGVTGYNNFRFPVFALNGALYIAEIEYNTALIRTKVMRTDK